MSDRPQSALFNYIFLLGKLEEACRAAQPRPQGFKGRLQRTFNTALNRTRTAALRTRAVLSSMLERAHRGDGVVERLKVEADEAAELERNIVRNIEVFTAGRTSADRPLSQIWPSPIPVERVLERTIAMTLGLLSERRSESPDAAAHFQGCLAIAVREVVAPALAWRILCDLSVHHEQAQPELLARVAARIDEGVLVQRDFTLVLSGDRVLHLPALVLVRAWSQLLNGPGCELPSAGLAKALDATLYALLNKSDLVEARNELFPVLTRSFGWGVHGSDRAYAINLARQHGAKAAFDTTRIEWLSAAHSEDVRPFAETARQDLGKAASLGQVFLRDETMDVNGLAGRAFWLAHACFRRPIAYRFSLLKGEHPDVEFVRDGELAAVAATAPSRDWRDYDAASTLAANLLERAANHSHADPEQQLLARRFLAGFATNPRYWRSQSVVARAPGWVDAYAATKGSRPSLIAHLRGRLAWQQAMRSPKRPDGALLDQALALYGECLALARDDYSGLDVEAPLHLFPELEVLIESRFRDKERPRNTLAAIDFILSRNFSIYMDIDAERAAILAGFSQAAIYPVAKERLAGA